MVKRDDTFSPRQRLEKTDKAKIDDEYVHSLLGRIRRDATFH